MADQPHIESLGEHNYLVRVPEGEEIIEIRMHASPGVIGRLPADTDEHRLVEATATYLIERQRADDLPATLDLDDVAAAYDDYLTEIGSRLHQPESEGP